MSNLRLPAVVHFVSDGKPWKIIAMEYLNLSIPSTTLVELKKQEYVHVFWRIEFFKATGDVPPLRSSFGDEADQLFQSLLKNVKEKKHTKKFIEKLDIFYNRNKKYQEEEERIHKKEFEELINSRHAEDDLEEISPNSRRKRVRPKVGKRREVEKNRKQKNNLKQASSRRKKEL